MKKKPGSTDYRRAQQRMSTGARDRVGLGSEAFITTLSAAAGCGLAPAAAGWAGVSTLMGSTQLASLLGGMFVTTTPVGWIVGAAVATGATGYALCKLLRSGASNDVRRADFVRRAGERADSVEIEEERLARMWDRLDKLVLRGEISTEDAAELRQAVARGQVPMEYLEDAIADAEKGT